MLLADRRVLLVLCALAFAAALLLGRPDDETPADPAPTASSAAAAETATDPAAEVVVHVVGAVRRSGLYRLPAGSRGQDAVAAAGGTTRRADVAGLNLAAPLIDGTQVVVPLRGATPRPVAGRSPGGSPPAPAAPVSLNAADALALDALPGVGPATAQRIVAWRDEHGGFTAVDDLLEVPGIGPAKLDALRSLVVP